MIYSYGFSHIGPYHVKANMVCQDSHCIRHITIHENGVDVPCVVAAVADGLGSAAHSEIGSSIAATTAVNHCADYLESGGCGLDDKGKITSKIRESFVLANKAVEARAKADKKDPKEYDTTLDLVVYAKGYLSYGHAGDSGIIVYLEDGQYQGATKQVQDDMGRVFPLCFQESWVFGDCRKKISSVLLCTDGMWDLFFPTLLRNEPNPIYVAQAVFFMDGTDLGYGKEKPEDVAVFMSQYVEKLPEAKVNDDKTVVLLYDDSIAVTKQPPEYYKSPDWAALQKNAQQSFLSQAYPHLYNADGTPKANPDATGKEKKSGSTQKSAVSSTPSGKKASGGEGEKKGSDPTGKVGGKRLASSVPSGTSGGSRSGATSTSTGPVITGSGVGKPPQVTTTTDTSGGTPTITINIQLPDGTTASHSGLGADDMATILHVTKAGEVIDSSSASSSSGKVVIKEEKKPFLETLSKMAEDVKEDWKRLSKSKDEDDEDD